MRVSGLLPFMLAAAPAMVAARGTLGLSLGHYKGENTCKGKEDWEDDLKNLKDVTKLVRTYTSSECHTAENILPVAAQYGFKVVLGTWVGPQNKDDESTDDKSFNADLEALKTVIPRGKNADAVHAITVGSETLYRGDLTGPQLHRYIREMAKAFKEYKDIKIGTADSWNKFADGTGDSLFTDNENGPMVTYVLANAFAYWQGTDAKDAYKTYFKDMRGAMEHIQKIAGDNADKINVVTGETGWPTDGGTDYENAKAGTKNAEHFWKTGVCGMLDWGVDLFYFEAFDESFKPDTKGDNGEIKNEKHWGLRTADRSPKFDISCPK
ncbi:Glucan 1-3-beta-glucosidase [Penicillium capsulatum]|uniref:glucan 1,3-beta-glucosidase n=1 Tax=Penicillium capsulatum TaxID=69766 RepID=A0A9W9LXB1_9EURO|nr:Glucan 1-3-beta-glucosidase [Penicillium capsulatum]KAJ6121597.1 Glucan 1-3-beta-glucosidase [Penicillium capsulatum]